MKKYQINYKIGNKEYTQGFNTWDEFQIDLRMKNKTRAIDLVSVVINERVFIDWEDFL